MGKKRILIADDNKAVRTALKSLLNERRQLIVCGEAIDGQDAVEKAKRLDPDVVLLDLAMPKMNGAEAACVLRESNPRAHLLLFTMYGDAIGPHLASAVNVDQVLSKQGGFADLIACIEGLAERPPNNATH